MIETREALDAVDDILATPGIDGVFVGPSDLSIALANGGIVDPHGPAVAEALTRVVAAAQARAKFVGLFCFDGAQARAARERGIKFTSISTDALMLRASARAELEKARS